MELKYYIYFDTSSAFDGGEELPIWERKVRRLMTSTNQGTKKLLQERV